MISKILIANRGEIALRIQATCKRLGIASVAVYAAPEEEHPFVAAADEAVCLGDGGASQTYLNQERILQAAAQTGADAIHPGYGFLSENSSFNAAVRQAGICFIGPSPEAMRLLGDKQQARKLASKLGISVPNGYQGEEQSIARLTDEAKRIGYPIMVKASGAGGGRGMRKVMDAKSLADALESVRRESDAFFGGSEIILEQLIAPARHIEVQLIADMHGSVLHLFDRDCSAQRRFQKIIEIAPAEQLPETVRTALYDAAVQLGREVDLCGAATVEFLVSPTDNSWYFLEVNPRLQVEHPATEMITGLDIVALQIEAAAGQPFSLQQTDIRCEGAAVEARVCAEIPEQQFVPSAGRISFLSLPAGNAVRVDHGLCQGMKIGTDYDSLLAKVIVHAADADSARQQLIEALADFGIIGVASSLGFLRRLLKADFPLSAQWVEQHLSALADQAEIKEFAKLAFLSHRKLEFGVDAAEHDPFLRFPAFGRFSSAPEKNKLLYRVSSNHLHQELRFEAPPYPDTEEQTKWPTMVGFYRSGTDPWGYLQTELLLEGRAFRIERALPAGTAEAHQLQSEGVIRAPLPGTVLGVHVEEGDSVEPGDLLVVLESMKMEHSVHADRSGTVQQLRAESGSTVEKGAALMTIG